MTKYFITIFTLLALVALVPSPAQAQSSADLARQLEEITKLVRLLEEQVEDRNRGTVVGPVISFTANDLECLKLDTTLRYGLADSSTETLGITALQEFLTNTGDYTYPSPTGYFGVATREAVVRFQNRMGIVPSAGLGVVEATTADRIEMVSCAETGSLSISPSFLASGQVGHVYSNQLVLNNLAGTNSGVSWQVVAGSLPRGLTLTSTGQISGRPVAAGVYELKIRALSTNNYLPLVDRQYQLIINDSDGMLFGA